MKSTYFTHGISNGLKAYYSSLTVLLVAVSFAPAVSMAAPKVNTITSTFYTEVYSGTNTANDGWTALGTSDWGTTFNSTSAFLVFNEGQAASGYARVSGQLWLGNFWIERVHLTFNTASLPANAIIDSARLEMSVVDGAFNSSTTAMYVVSSSQPGNLATLASYGQVGSTDLGHAFISGPSDVSINLNTAGLGNILPGSISKFALRSWHDFNNIQPLSEIGAGLEGDSMYIISAEDSATLTPRLVVTWHVPKGGKGGEKGEGRDDDKKGKRGNHH